MVMTLSTRQYAISSIRKAFAIGLENLFYPKKCVACRVYLDSENDAPEPILEYFCQSCIDNHYHPITEPFCTRCGIQHPASHHENHVCGDCLKYPLVPAKIRAFAAYSGVFKQIIPQFKYQSRLGLATLFGQMLHTTYKRHFKTMDIHLVIPIPLHASKLKQRGFNQAYLLVHHLEKEFVKEVKKKPDWSIDIQTLIRKKRTESQTGFDVDQRKRNLKDAFILKNAEAVKQKNILLVDDVLTTGATCDEAARVLYRHGAKNVYALVLSRA